MDRTSFRRRERRPMEEGQAAWRQPQAAASRLDFQRHRHHRRHQARAGGAKGVRQPKRRQATGPAASSTTRLIDNRLITASRAFNKEDPCVVRRRTPPKNLFWFGSLPFKMGAAWS